ncbi:hypothetical protein L7F22_025196 [Adiantum nelumboides]|nr:hypothetical protein [Adiantum nelumboides]
MADDSETSARFCGSQNNREPVFCDKDNPAEASSSLSANTDHEQTSDESCFYSSDLLNMDYFAAPSKVHLVQQEMGVSTVAKTASFEAGKNVESPPITNLEFDWVEPSTPIQSCAIGTSEEDDSSSRSCSNDSREGCGEHFLREKDADQYIGDYTFVLHDTPMDAIQESHGEASGAIDDGGGGNKAPWKGYLGAWISEAGRSSTFCSIALAAAVIGLVLVGSGWYRIRLQLQRFRCRLSYNEKGLSRAMYQLVHIKGSTSKLRRVPVIKARNCFSGV